MSDINDNSTLSREQVEFLLPEAFNAALRAGASILEIYYDHDHEMDISLKDDNTPLTEADCTAHSKIREYLSKSHVPLMSEEGREMIYEERMGWDLFWLVDPLDGTKEFLKNNGEFTVNIALLANNKPYLSVVYVPYIGKMYFAIRGAGSFLIDGLAANAEADYKFEEIANGAQKLPLTDKPNTPIKIAISRSHNTEETFQYIDVIKKFFPDAEVVEQGSSYKFCLLAEGAMDYYIRTTNTYEWDTAAGELVLELAEGSTLSMPNFEPLEYNKMSLLNPHFFSRSKYMKDMEEAFINRRQNR